jgi:hypothetical protein
MTESSYKDQFLALRGRRFALLDPGREIGALVDLVCTSPEKLSWQSRAIADKLITIVRARRRKQTYVALYDSEAEFSALAVCFIFAKGLSEWLHVFGANSINYRFKSTALIEDLRSRLSLGRSKSELVSFDFSRAGVDDFWIQLISADDFANQERVLSQFTHGTKGVMLVRDFSLRDKKFIAEQYRRAGLSITETADGYGECWSL